jgi:dethiobiotin synthetase
MLSESRAALEPKEQWKCAGHEPQIVEVGVQKAIGENRLEHSTIEGVGRAPHDAERIQEVSKSIHNSARMINPRLNAITSFSRIVMPRIITETAASKRLTRRRVLFITGTDTGVGKTALSVLLVRYLRTVGLRAAALKPIASGGRGDAVALATAQEGELPLDRINPWHFRASVAPPLAARREGHHLRLSPLLSHLRTGQRQHPLLIVEGAGGLLSPLGEGFDSRDVIRALRATPVVVARNRLGAVHQVRAVLSALPSAVRVRTVVVLSNPQRPTAASCQNESLLREFEPGIPIFTFPWSPRWQEMGVPLTKATRAVLSEIMRAAGVPVGSRREAANRPDRGAD